MPWETLKLSMTSLSVMQLLVLTTVHPLAGRSCGFNRQTHFLDCSSRGLTLVPTDEKHFNGAKGIDLCNNHLRVIKNLTFSNVSCLNFLDLSNNSIYSLELDAFQGLNELKVLNLSVNHDLDFSLHYLNPKTFEPLQSLEVFRFQEYASDYNFANWTGIDSTFKELKNLRTLFLDLPEDFVFGDGFGALKNLTTISTSWGTIRRHASNNKTLRNETFAVFTHIPITELRLINCGISTIESGAFDVLTSLHTLDLTNNIDLGLSVAIQSLHSFEGRVMKEVKLAGLNNGICNSGNHFAIKKADILQLGKLKIKHLDLSENFINYVDDFHPVDVFPLLLQIETLNVSFHSLRCFPNFLLNYIADLAHLPVNLSLATVDISNGFILPTVDGDWHIKHTLTRRKRLTASNNIRPHQQLFPFPSLKKLNLGGIMYWGYLDTPLNFTSAWNLTYLNLGNNFFRNCDQSMLNGLGNLTHLDISGIHCPRVDPNYFEGSPKLIELSVSNFLHMGDILRSPGDSSPFAKLKLLENIDLSGNKIIDIHSEIFTSNKNLRSINLANNKLQRIPWAILKLSKLRVLDLSSNAFTHFNLDEMTILDKWMKDGVKNPFKLMFENNPLQCTCDTVLFIRWIREKNILVTSNHQCVLSNGSWVYINEFAENVTDFQVKCVSRTYLIIGVVGCLSLVVLVALCAAIYRYRLNLRYWLYTRLKAPDRMFLKNAYNYDAFVAYTSDDYLWTKNELWRKLESDVLGDPLRLCFHDRDFIPGKPIHENIVDKIRESRRILLVISRAFLNSVYGPLEIEYAGMKCLEEGREDVILCVLMEDIPARQMPRALRNLWHKITFLKWTEDPGDQAIFWRNLREALL